jgi:hypothetical protein
VKIEHLQNIKLQAKEKDKIEKTKKKKEEKKEKKAERMSTTKTCDARFRLRAITMPCHVQYDCFGKARWG